MRIKIDIGSVNDYIKSRLQLLEQKYAVEIVYEGYNGLLEVDYLLASKLTEEDLKTSNILKKVFVPFTGLNRFPLESLENKNIKISNTHAKAHIVAERALALTLSVMGKINTYDKALRNNHQWLTREFWGDEFWHSLYKKKCGIVGMGKIGQNIKKLLSPFNCDIVNLKRDENKALANHYVKDINEMITVCDLLFFTCTLNEETKHLINTENVYLLEKKFIINVSRGEVIQEEALYKALNENIVLGAGIDVWYNYPKDNMPTNPSSYDLSSFENLVMSPHASCHSSEGQHAYYEDIFDQIETELNQGQNKKT